MRKLAVLALAVLAASCSGGDDGQAHSFSEPDTLAGEFSYVYGYLMAEASADYGDIDFSQIIHGVSDFASSASDFSAAEMNDIMARYQQQLISEREAARAALAGKNRKVAEDFLAVNGQRMGVVTLPSGMQYEVLGKGDGESAADAGKLLRVFLLLEHVQLGLQHLHGLILVLELGALVLALHHDACRKVRDADSR